MAQKVFKGFMQVTEGTFTGETGYIYFVRNSSNTGATDGYLQFNGKKYGTAAEVAAALEAKIGTLPEGYSNVVDYVNAQLSAVTDNFSSESVTGSSNGVEVEIGQAGGNVTAVTVTAPDFANTYAGKSDFESVSGVVDTINSDYLKAADKTELNNAITAETAAREALEDRVETLETSAATKAEVATLSGRVDVLEVSAATKTEVGTLSGRVDTLEEGAAALSASTRLTALESSAHTHANKTVLDGISQEKVDAWDSMAGGANVVLSAYTGSDAGVTDGFLKSYEIFQGGVSKGKIDIPKDMVVTSGVITANTNDEKVLRLTIANQSEPVDILVSDLVDVYTAGDGIEISTANTVSAKVVEANGLSVGSNGIAMALADGSNAGAMSAADFTKLGTIEASAQTNVIEEIKVDGTALTVDNKSVNIQLPDYSGTYAPLSLTGTVETNRTDFDNYTAATDTRLDTIESGYTQNSVYNAYTAATDNALTSADTRLDALEAISGQSHTHDNKAVLDTLTAESAATWNNVAGSASTWNDVASSASTWNGVAGSADTRISALEASAATWNNVAGSADTRIAALEAESADTRLDAIETDYLTSTDKTALENSITAETAAREALADRVDDLEAISADTRLNALEALTGDTSSALQSISAGDASVSVGTKDSNNDQTVAVAVSSVANNALKLESDGLFAAIYYDGDDSN